MLACGSGACPFITFEVAKHIVRDDCVLIGTARCGAANGSDKDLFSLIGQLIEALRLKGYGVEGRRAQGQ